MPAELFGYLISVLAISEVIDTTLWKWPWLAIPVRLFVAGYLIVLATHLWRRVSLMDPGSGPISVKYVFVTTLLNPKAMIFALIVNPLHSVSGLPRILAFSAMVLFMSVSWILAGTAIRRGLLPTGGYSTICRVGAVSWILAGTAIRRGLLPTGGYSTICRVGSRRDPLRSGWSWRGQRSWRFWVSFERRVKARKLRANRLTLGGKLSSGRPVAGAHRICILP